MCEFFSSACQPVYLSAEGSLYSRCLACFNFVAGILLHYEDSSLQDYYFLDPQWLCDMLACVITIPEINRHARSGKFHISLLSGRGTVGSRLPLSLVGTGKSKGLWVWQDICVRLKTWLLLVLNQCLEAKKKRLLWTQVFSATKITDLINLGLN